jgi:hypothetical protein
MTAAVRATVEIPVKPCCREVFLGEACKCVGYGPPPPPLSPFPTPIIFALVDGRLQRVEADRG